jgi:probable rRNA maturation factor
MKKGPICEMAQSPWSTLSEDDSEPSASTLRILIANQQLLLPIDEDRLRSVARHILEDANYPSAILSIAIVDDPTIHQLNRQYLQHDWPTDVLSFPLEQRAGHLEGEVVVSADTAVKAAAEVPWPGTEELLLYVIHGTLHLVGHRDKSPGEVAKMRAAERFYLQWAGVVLVPEDDRWRAIGGFQTS